MEFPGDERAAAEISFWSKQPDRAVLFDFNGTLSDDEPLLLQIFVGLAKDELGTALDEADYLARLAGRSDREILEVMVAESAHSGEAALVDELLLRRRDRYLALAAQRPPITPAAADLVRALHAAGIKVGIVTGAQRPDVEAVLAGAGLRDLFVGIVTEEDVTVGKPDPQGYYMGADLLDVRPGAVLAFEDSIAGITAAKAAGMTCIGIPGTRPAAELATIADGIVRRLDPALLHP